MARPEIVKTPFAKRLKEVRGVIKREAFALQLGISERSLGNYERGDRLPDSAFLATLGQSTEYNLNWLLTGVGPKKAGKAALSSPSSDDFDLPEILNRDRQAPIAGLASCGPDGWSRLESTQFRAELPKSIQHDKDAFAVISRGESMQPFGIYEGYLCFCSPATERLIGDIVCIERKEENGETSLTIKKLGMIGHGAVEIIGYLPLKETVSSGVHSKQSQELFWETVHNDDIERISVVTHIHTRPSAY